MFCYIFDLIAATKATGWLAAVVALLLYVLVLWQESFQVIEKNVGHVQKKRNLSIIVVVALKPGPV